MSVNVSMLFYGICIFVIGLTGIQIFDDIFDSYSIKGVIVVDLLGLVSLVGFSMMILSFFK